VAALAADLPLALVNLQLIVMSVISNWLSHITVRVCKLTEVGRRNSATKNVIQH
jgi:hypothetical protein